MEEIEHLLVENRYLKKDSPNFWWEGMCLQGGNYLIKNPPREGRRVEEGMRKQYVEKEDQCERLESRVFF